MSLFKPVEVELVVLRADSEKVQLKCWILANLNRCEFNLGSVHHQSETALTEMPYY